MELSIDILRSTIFQAFAPKKIKENSFLYRFALCCEEQILKLKYDETGHGLRHTGFAMKFQSDHFAVKQSQGTETNLCAFANAADACLRRSCLVNACNSMELSLSNRTVVDHVAPSLSKNF